MSERAHNTRYSKDQHSKGYEDQLDNNLNHLARMILENRNTVFVTGAGLSVASGIPTFRGSDNSVWSKNTVNSATTTSFHKDPLKWYNEFWIESFPHKYTTYQPNNGHESISWLANMFPNVNVITQNIDSLHQQTKQRWPHEQKLVEIHGRMGLYRCMAGTKNVPALQRGHFVVPKKPVVKEEPTCPNQEKNYLDASSFPSALQDVLLGHSSSLLTSVPECPHCAGPLAPLALLFNETYDSHCFYQFGKASKWVEESEAIVFVGTSFAVAITKYAVAQAQNRPLGCALFNINPFQELELRPNLRPKNMLKNAEDVLPRLVEIIKSKLGSHLSEEELEISSNGSSTPTKRSRTPASDSEMSVWESPSADELRKRFPLLHTFDHARYDLDPMLPEPLPQSSVRAALSFDNCRKNHPVRTVEAQINKIWRASQAENPKLFNGLKFRMSGYSFSPSGAFRHKRTQQHRERHSTLTLYLGLTDYKSFRGTNWSPQATQLLSDGVRDFGDAGAYMSQKLGVVSALMNQDGQLVCLRRSAWVGEGHGQLDGLTRQALAGHACQATGLLPGDAGHRARSQGHSRPWHNHRHSFVERQPSGRPDHDRCRN